MIFIVHRTQVVCWDVKQEIVGERRSVSFCGARRHRRVYRVERCARTEQRMCICHLRVEAGCYRGYKGEIYENM